MPAIPLILIIFWFAATTALAQQPLVADAVSPQLIESRIQEVDAATDLDDTARNELLDLYRRSQSYIEATRSSNTNGDFFAQARVTAGDEAQRVREELDKAVAESSEVTVDLSAGTSAREIDQRVRNERANQAAIAAKFNALEQQIAANSSRPTLIRQRLVEARQFNEQLAGDFKLQSRPEDSALLREARQWLLLVQTAALNAEIRMLDQELLSHPMRLELIQAQRDATSRSLGRANTRVQILETLLAERRRSETDLIIAETDLAGLGDAADHPVIRELAERNRELADQIKILNQALEQVESDTTAASERHQIIQQNFLTARRYIDIAGLSQALGQVLHEQRQDLPDLSKYRRRAKQREQIIAEAGLQDIRLETEQRNLKDLEASIDSQLLGLPAEQRDALVKPTQRLLTSLRTLLRRSLTANGNYLQALGELEFQEKQVFNAAMEFSDFLSENLLWVRNKGAVSISTLLDLPGETAKFLAPGRWLEAVKVPIHRFTRTPTIVLSLLIAGVLLMQSRALRRRLRATAAEVDKPGSDRFTFTAAALGYTVLLALPWPLLAAASGWEISQSLGASEEAKAIGAGLLRASRALFFISTARALCLPGGLGEAHFKWAPLQTQALRVQFNQLLFTFVLPVFIVTMTFSSNPANYGGALSRLAIVIVTAGLMRFLIRLLRPGTGILAGIAQARGESTKFAQLWFVLGVLIPSSAAIAALSGYIYSATTLMVTLNNSLLLILVVLVAHELVARWLLVMHQRLRLRVLLERREAERAAREKKLAEGGSGEDPPAPLQEPEMDVASLDTDTRKLLYIGLLVAGAIGLGAIWTTVLPALAILGEITLWDYVDQTLGEQQFVPVTLADLLLAIVYLVITVSAVRTIPALLEAVLRQRKSIAPGSRLAFATLARYGIVMLGIFMIAGQIGFQWSQVQWLVAALGVGIGFGLQEIVANFISGLIILLERPIRVGDIVTVGDVSGTVTRLQMRATAVTTWDRRELLVPNKEFVTTRVLNWSLSDEVIRIVVKVGVAYDTDMRKALDVVTGTVVKHERVLEDPKPLITFDEFGDNSLLITARCFIGSLNHRRETLSELNLAINERLKEAGIIVAFPQRDVHLDTSSPLDVRLHQN